MVTTVPVYNQNILFHYFFLPKLAPNKTKPGPGNLPKLKPIKNLMMDDPKETVSAIAI